MVRSRVVGFVETGGGVAVQRGGSGALEALETRNDVRLSDGDGDGDGDEARARASTTMTHSVVSSEAIAMGRHGRG